MNENTMFEIAETGDGYTIVRIWRLALEMLKLKQEQLGEGFVVSFYADEARPYWELARSHGASNGNPALYKVREW